MKVCILGDCLSVFLSQLVKNIKKENPEYRIDGIQIGGNKSLQFDDFFDNLTYFNNENIKNSSILNKITKYVFFKYKFSNIKKYDIVNVHFVSNFCKFFWSDIKKISDKRILSFWGSDFHRISDREKQKSLSIFLEADVLTFTSYGMANEFKTYYNNIEISKKIKVCSFGLESLDLILKISKQEQNNFRQRNKINTDKILVAIASASFKSRRHIKIIDVILTLDKTLLEKCHFVFQMNYGDMDYKEIVKHYLHNKPLEYTFLENFMSYEEVSQLRLETDIMINLSDNDQFSASMQEILFAKNIIITGKWLPYNLLWDKDVFALVLDDFEGLIENFKYTIKNIKSLKEKCEKNPDKIYEISSWKTNTKKWIALYINTLNGKF